MTKILILTIAIVLAVFANTVVGRKAGQGQQDFIPGAPLPGAYR